VNQAAIVHIPTQDRWALDWQSFMLDAQYRKLSPHTVLSYQAAGKLFHSWLLDNHRSTDPGKITRQEIQEWVISMDTVSSTTVLDRFIVIRVFFNFLVRDGSLKVAPTDRMRPPKAREVLTAVLTLEEQQRLLSACQGSSLEKLRDTAIIRTLLDTGLRKSELANIMVEDVNLSEQTLFIRQRKGGRSAYVPIGVKAARELDKYIRTRARHRHGGLPDLWICRRGKFGSESIYPMIVALGKKVGIEGLHPHSFRHTFASSWLEGGGQERDLMKIAGWKSASMLQRYGAASANQRAMDAHKKFSPGDRL
jgi:site-specific recombinase XerD